MATPLFATRIPESTAEAIREEARRQRRPLNSVVDTGLRHFLNLPAAQRDALAIGEPMEAPERTALALLNAPRPQNRRKVKVTK